MAYVYADAGGSPARPMVMGLFAASCLLSIVSFYTTMQGMALYLAPWFALLASLGIQTALVLVAWLIGFTRTGRVLLITVYVITAIVSIAFSYVSLYTWFAARERPASVQRRLYDALTAVAAKTEEPLAAAITEGRKHVLAIDEMTAAEKAFGHISRAQDSDPYLASVREAVATEARTFQEGYREGAGQGVRYTAFDRHGKLARESLAQLESSRKALGEFRAQAKPLDPAEQQLRAFHAVYDGIPWSEVERQLHTGKLARPEPPQYADYVDRAASNQEDLMIAFSELFSAPTSRHLFSLSLATFIDVVIFLLAYSAGPYFAGAPERRWCRASAAVDDADEQVFARGLLRKIIPGPQGTARVAVDQLSPGELQLCLVLAGRGLAIGTEEDGRQFYLIDPAFQEALLETVSHRGLPLRASAKGFAAGA